MTSKISPPGQMNIHAKILQGNQTGRCPGSPTPTPMPCLTRAQANIHMQNQAQGQA